MFIFEIKKKKKNTGIWKEKTKKKEYIIHIKIGLTCLY